MKIDRYKTIPIEVEVVRFDGSLGCAKELKQWGRSSGVGLIMAQADLNDDKAAKVHVMMEGRPHPVLAGDYIVRQEDRFFVYTEEVFKTAFEVIEDE